MNPIRIAAAVILDDAGRTLLVRKRGTAFFMQPGGKLEAGESPLETLTRELREELGCTLQKAQFLGIFSAPAANEAARVVEAELFHVEITGEIEPGSEIEQFVWTDPASVSDLLLAPLTKNEVLRHLRSNRLRQRIASST
jgi:8-oxo-dGTP diphosphatase